VCLYGPAGSNRWTMTERGRRHVERTARAFVIGPSQVEWTGDALKIDIDERAVPLPRRVRGRIVVHPHGLSRFVAPLDADGRHRWGPIAPCARIEVTLDAPALRWGGNAYIDSNEGDAPVEQAFRRWDWLRAPLADGRCAVLYDVQPHAGDARLIGARFAPDGRSEAFTLPARRRLLASPLWRVDRRVPVGDRSDNARVVRTLEDTPFYARSLIDLPLDGASVPAIHETLDVGRLASPAVQWMLPFRMPRVA
jgi:carotenoid 1,2-hydratase